ncbi:MAG: aminoglycoside adenylyltransferase domain-containing protein [Planctomycetota bacterium]
MSNINPRRDTLRPINTIDPLAAGPVKALCNTLETFFRERILSILLHGSIVNDDFAIGYSDIDFLVVFNDTISDDDCGQLREMRKRFKAGDCGQLGYALEGAFLPRSMLDPSVLGSAFWWGTSGERRGDKNPLDHFTLQGIRDNGCLIFGCDILSEIPVPTEPDLLKEVDDFIVSARQHAAAGRVKSVDWLLTASRLLKWVTQNEMSSKSAAADWAMIHAQGPWRDSLRQAKSIRLDTASAENPNAKAWLATLRTPILEAIDELESALRQRKKQ